MVLYRIIFSSTAAYATLTLAAPSVQLGWQLEQSRGVVTVPVSRVRRIGEASKSGNPGFDVIQKAYARWGGRDLESGDGDGSGDVPAAPPQQEPDYEYIVPITIGNETYNAVVDTGVTDSWIKKESFKNLGKTCFQQSGWTWGSEVAEGDIVCEDKITVGNAAVSKQAIGLANKQGDPDPYTDGVLGLAPGDTLSTIKPKKQNGWLANVLSSLPAQIFGLDIRHEAEGSITFGGVPSGIDENKLKWAALDTSSGKYSVDASGGYKVGDEEFKVEGSHKAIVDTGTTLVFMDPKIVARYYTSVPGSEFNKTAYGGWTLPCKGDIKTFSVSVAEHMITIPKEHMSYFGVGFGNTTCYGGLQGREGDTWIYGATFIKSVHAVFDLAKNQFGVLEK